MDILFYICAALIGAAIGIAILIAVQRATARSRAKTIIDDANREAEVIMKDKLLEAREQELKIKSEAEKQANQRMSRIQSEEAKMKQRQAQLNQQRRNLTAFAARLRTLSSISPGFQAKRPRRNLSSRSRMKPRPLQAPISTI